MQLEQESKTDKDDLSKDAFKEKKAFDDQLLTAFEHKYFILETQILYTLEKSLFIQSYHPVVPTPPPNV